MNLVFPGQPDRALPAASQSPVISSFFAPASARSVADSVADAAAATEGEPVGVLLASGVANSSAPQAVAVTAIIASVRAQRTIGPDRCVSVLEVNVHPIRWFTI